MLVTARLVVAPTRMLPRVREAAARLAPAKSYAAPVTVRDWVVRLAPVRPVTPLVFEAKATETAPASEPAFAAERPT